VNGALKIDVVFIGVVSFIFLFLVAGVTGMWLSHVSLNISMHDTLYVVAHFHLMLSGAVVMGIFVGFYFYFHVFFCEISENVFVLSHSLLLSWPMTNVYTVVLGKFFRST
jgi:cytochrome c oxidase subunit 1